MASKPKARPKKKPAKKPETRGRPTKYSKGLVVAAEFMARAGMIDKDMAEKIGVHKSTFDKWKNDHPEFRAALIQGKMGPNEEVEASLFKLANGYMYDEIDRHCKTVDDPIPGDPKHTKEVVVSTHLVRKHVPGNVMACNSWLNNRSTDPVEPGDPARRRWSSKQEIAIDFVESPLAAYAKAMLENFRLSDDDPNRLTDQ